ncbi:MAG: calcium/sodium antiporter [Pseudomonadota bacterium]
MAYLFILAGLVLLFVGGEVLVRGSVGIARRFGLSELLIGIVLVGFGTSMPELVTSLQAVGQGAVGMSVGNVTGSNIANVMLVLGTAALIRPIFTDPKALSRDFIFMVFATIVFLCLAYFDLFTRAVGIVLVALLLIYIVGSFLLDKKNADTAALHTDEGELIEANDALWLSCALAVAGVAGVVIGANLLVNGGVTVATRFGVSDTLIGLSIVAIGTSLPELATSIVSAFKGKSDVALGNVIGSNIFNVLGIIGVTTIFLPFSLNDPNNSVQAADSAEFGAVFSREASSLASNLTWTDVSTLILSVFFVILFAFSGKRLARWEGATLLAGYILFLGLAFNLIPSFS